MRTPVDPMTPSVPLRPEAMSLDLPARTRADVLEALAARAAVVAGLDPLAVARALADREALGSTGVGSGVAMPHAPVDGLDAALVLFVRLARPIDWEAIDDEPVDLVLAVLSPTRVAGASMNVLSKFARLLRSDAVRARLRVGDAAEVAAELAAA